MRKNIIFALSLIVLALLIVNLLFRSGLFSEFLKGLFVQKIEHELQASVRIEKFRFNLFPPFVILDGFSLQEKTGDSVPVLKADQIILSFSPWSLLTEYLLIHKIHIQDPKIHLVWKEHGGTNFNFLFQSAPAKQKLPFIIQKVILSNASLRLDQMAKNYHGQMTAPDVRIDADPGMTNFQVSGSSRDILYQFSQKGPAKASSFEWKLTVAPGRIEIKKMAAITDEGVLSLKGTIDLASGPANYPFKMDSDFQLNMSKFSARLDAFMGHGQVSGSFTPGKNIAGNLKLSHLALQKGKNSQNLGELAWGFSTDFSKVNIEHFSGRLFDAKMEGKVKLLLTEPALPVQIDYKIENLSLAKTGNLLYPEQRKYLEQKTLDADGTLKINNLNFRQFEGKGHLRLAGGDPKEVNAKNRLTENMLYALSQAETDYETTSSAFLFKNASIQIGSNAVRGEGSIQKDGRLSSRISFTSDQGGEIVSWLGYPQWSGEAEFSGEVSGTLTSPVVEGVVALKNVFFNDHSLGNGKGDVRYSEKQLELSNISIVKGTGNYSGEGSVRWKSPEGLIYQITANASRGVPKDIISLFIQDIPLDTHATGPVTISGNLNTLLVRADLELENGSLYGEAFDRGHAEFEVTGEEITFKQASLVHGSSSIQGKGEIRFQGGYKTELASENFDLKDSTILIRYLPGLEGSFKGTINGVGTFAHPQMKLTGVLPFLLYRNQSLKEGTINLSLQDGQLDAHVKFKDRPVSMTGTISLTEPFFSKLAIQGEEIPLAPLIATTSGYQTSSLSGSFSGKVEIDGPLSHPQTLNYSVNLSALNAELSGYPVSIQDNIVFQLREGTLTIEAFRLKGEGTSLTIAGGLQLFKQFNLFITGEADLSLLTSIKKEISYGQGKAYLALKISDNWNDPKIQGGITVQDGEIRTSLLPRTIHISSLGLFFNERQVLLESLDIDSGEGVLQVTGKIDLARFRIGRFGLILEAHESRFLLFSGWTSTVSGSLIYQGDPSFQSLQGELTLSQGVYNKKFDFRTLLNRVNKLAETREPTPLIGNTRLNIRITGDKDLKIDNNVARLPFSMDVTLKGTVDHPVLIGRLEADSGTILFYSKTFEVQGAAIDFIDPESINPLIDIKAKTQIIGKDRTYQIELSLSGTLQELNRTLTSDDPTLTETDIWALILAGRKATEVAANPYSQQQLGGQFIPLVIESPLENVLEGFTGVDRLTIEPLSSSVRSTGGPRLAIEQRLMGGKLLLNYAYTVNPSQDQIVKLDYLINRHISLQGMRNEDGNPAGNITFRFEFK